MRFHPLSVIAIATLMLLPPQTVFSQEATVVSRTLKNQRLNELGIWNLGSDKVFEVFTTSVSGKAACYSADTLKPLWEQQISDESLTAPVIGNFMATGAPVLAFASASGKVYFLWPGSGEIISSVDISLSCSVAPSVATMSDGDKLILVGDAGQISILDLDATTGLPRERWTVPNTLSGSTAFSVVGQISQPAACADLNGDAIPEVVVVSDSGVLQVVSLSDPPQRYSTRLPQQSSPTTPAAMGDLSGTGQNIIMLGVNASFQFFKWDAALPPEKAVESFLSEPAYGASVGHLLIGPLNDDRVNDLLSTAEGTVAARYLGNDFSGKQAFLDIAPQHLATSATPFSPAIAVTRRDGTKSIVALDNDGVAWDWQPTSPENTITRFPGVPVPMGATPAGDLTGNGKLSIIVWNQDDFLLSVVTLPIDLAPTAPAAGVVPHSGPVLTLGVNYARNGQWGAEWAAKWEAKLQAAAAALQQARASGGSGEAAKDTDLSTDSVSMIAGLDPQDPIAVEFRANRTGRGFRLFAIGGGVIALLAVLLIALRRFRKPRPR